MGWKMISPEKYKYFCGEAYVGMLYIKPDGGMLWHTPDNNQTQEVPITDILAAKDWCVAVTVLAFK